MISICLNGEKQELTQEMKLSELMQQMNVPKQAFAVAVNRNIIPRSELEKIQVKEGDQIEIVHAVGGG